MYNNGENLIFTLGEDKYVGTLKRDHKHMNAAFVFVGVFQVDKLLFNNIVQIYGRKAKLQKVANKGSVFRTNTLKDVENTEMNSSSFTHASERERCKRAALLSIMLL